MHLPVSPELPAVVAHRGYAARYPENSLAAIEAALWLGLEYVEFDVQLTRDGVPVLFHDVGLERITGEPGRIVDLTWEEARALNTGEPGRLGMRYRHVRPATLQDVAGLLARHSGATAFVEIKPESLVHFGSDEVWSACEPALSRIPRPVVTSFDRDLLARVRRDWPVAWVLPEFTDATLAAARRLKPQYLFCNWKRLPGEPRELPSGPWEWAIYEVASAHQARELARRGVTLVETMDPPAVLGGAAERQRKL
jgi:glycerophosphoryl diester phosphodiesterase